MKDLTFLITYSEDTPERLKNFNLILPYYKQIYPDSTFIVVEYGSKKTLADQKNIEYYFIKSDKPFNKSKCYNLALHNTKTELVCFLDIDCIVSKESLDKAISKALLSPNIFIGYNGTCIYFEYNVKEAIKTNNLYDELIEFVDKSNLYTNYTNQFYLVGNTRAVGGCLVGQTKTFKEINGFNPFIKGWGYEDNEVVLRAHKLGFFPHFVQSSKPILLHLPHHIVKSDRSQHPDYDNNGQIYNSINSMSKEKLQDYIKTWKLI